MVSGYWVGGIGNNRYRKLENIASTSDVKFVRPYDLKPLHRDKRVPPPPQGEDFLWPKLTVLHSQVRQRAGQCDPRLRSTKICQRQIFSIGV